MAARKAKTTTKAKMTTNAKAKAVAKTATMPATPDAITTIEYGEVQEAYDHFNRVLFDGTLPDVFITYQRKAHSAGYFSANRFSSRTSESGQHELALNPNGFTGQSDAQIMQTLVHEQSHVWQEAFGTPSKRGYHNNEWAAKMKSIGLMPSTTGMVGGKETGQRMSDYPIPGERFLKAFAELAATGWRLNLESAHYASGTKAPPSKVKFTCLGCGSNMWGKPDSKDICGACNQWRVAAEQMGQTGQTDVQSYDQAAE